MPNSSLPPLLSIIVPTYNEERAIIKTLNSFHDLAIPHELIVTDASSNDHTVELARQDGVDLVLTCPRPNGRQPTIGANRNNGARAARGKYFVFVDSDCRIPETTHFFERALEHFNKDSELVALTVTLITEPSLRTRWDSIILGANNLFYAIMNNFLGRGVAMGKFQMIRAEAFRAAGGFREDLAMSEDIDMFHRLSKIGHTRMDRSLEVYHSNRRARTIGWPRLLCIWVFGTFYFTVTGRSMKETWEDIR